MKALLTIAMLFVSVAVVAQTQSPSGSPTHVICDSGCAGGAGGGGLAQLQVRTAGNVWTDVGFNVGDLFLPVVLQTGAATIGAISNTSFNVGNFPATYDISDRSGRALGTIANTSFNVGNFPVTQAVSLTTLPALTAGSAVIGHVIVDTAPSTAVTNAGTFATQATLAAETTKVIGTVNIAASQTVGLVAGSAVIGHVIVDTAPSTAVTNAGLTNLDVALSTRTKPADQQHAIIDSGAVAATLAAETTKVIGTVNQGTSPWVVSCSTTNCPQPTLTKGTQGATGFSTQDLKDAGRNRVTFTADRVTPAASDTLVTFVKNVGGTATTGQTTYTVTTGKTFRVQSMHIGAADSTTTALSVRAALRENTGGTCTATSAAAVMINTATPGAVAAEGSSGTEMSFPDGLEFPAADSICISAIGSTSTGTLTATVVGFEY